MGCRRSRGFIQICSSQEVPRRVGGRYTPIEGPDTLYLASSERAANAEWKAGLQALFSDVMLPPKTVFATDVNLTRVLDLSTDEIQRTLRTNSAELAQPWKTRNRPVTQTLGLACFESGRFSALRYRSTKAAPSYCLAVFPSRMNPPEYVSVLDPQEFFSQIHCLKERRHSFLKAFLNTFRG